MTASGGDGRPPAAQGGVLSGLLSAATAVVLLALGAATGLVAAPAAGWLTRYWEAGITAQVLGAAGLVALLAVFYAACRLCGWGSRSVLGAACFAGGFVVVTMALSAYVPGGDVVLQGHPVHYGYLFGSMAVLALAVVRSIPNPVPSFTP
ncbi:hypothetical protein [Nocardiopsis algeriensis]|uniref:Uncharacterized protein n=1 Tax=Nocardiopsis algeriensis TaxID=1478215 RepID=A0A841IQH5_9ACTN|nr:hypothetical protein [Nocardiopsis algeriensis]